MEPDAWLSRVEEAVAAIVGTGPPPAADDTQREALLELARIAAHTSERWTAPITTYLAGLALAEVDGAERGAKLQALVAALE